MTLAIHRIISAILFLPVFIFYLLAHIFEMLFYLFNNFHYLNFYRSAIPEIKGIDTQTDIKNQLIIRILLALISPFDWFIFRLKEFNYKF